MDDGNRIYAATREEWRRWLERNHDSSAGVWLIYYKKGSGKASVPYDDAVEEAICFGWIDSTVNRVDDERYMQKFTPRNKNSKWSRLNIQRAERLIVEGKMATAGLLKYNERIEDVEYDTRNSNDGPDIPADLLKRLGEIPEALEHFNGLSPSYRRMSIGWIDAARREETRQRRIDEVATLAAEKKKMGMK